MYRLPRPLLRIAAFAAAATAVAVVPALPASAAGEVGYIRVAHLSPDTAKADISLNALSGGSKLYSLTGVAYGGVSKYMSLPTGTYALAMAPTEQGTNTPIVNADVEVKAGTAETIAAIGPNASIRITTIADDLTAPTGNKSRVRIVQASTTQNSVSVTAADGTKLATNAAFASVGNYTELPSGSTKLTLAAGGTDATANVDLTAGTAQTLFVVDDSKGALTVVPVTDSAAVTETPVGGVATGGGALAAQTEAGLQLAGAGIGAGVLVAAALVVVAIRNRRNSAPSRHRS